MLPQWPPGTVTILCTGGAEPHAIPVSAAVRAGPDVAMIALAAGRESLARLREQPRMALAIVSEGVAATAYGRAEVADEALVEGVACVAIYVDHVQDHDRSSFELESGIRFRWTDPSAQARDEEVLNALARLAGEIAASPREERTTS